MAIAADVLWTADEQHRASLRHLGWGVAATVTGTLGLLVAGADQPLGYAVAGGAALVVVTVFLRWLRDRGRLVEVREADEPGADLLLRTVGGRTHRVSAADVRSVILVGTVWPHDPDAAPGHQTGSSELQKVVLHIRVSGQSRRSRPVTGMKIEERDRLLAEWRRLCPGATVKKEVHIPLTGTGD